MRAIYNIPRDANRKLRDFPTLAHVIGFVHERRPDLRSPPAPPGSPLQSPQPPPAGPQPAEDPVKERLLALVAEKTGYPKDMLDLDLDLEADLGIDTVKQADMFASVRAIYNIPRDENLQAARLSDPGARDPIRARKAPRLDGQPAPPAAEPASAAPHLATFEAAGRSRAACPFPRSARRWPMQANRRIRWARPARGHHARPPAWPKRWPKGCRRWASKSCC